MKRIIIFLALAGLTGSAYGQKDSTATSCFIIKTDAVLAAYNFFSDINAASLTIEKGFAKHHSLQLMGRYDKNKKYESRTCYLQPEYKYYWNAKKNFSGFYTGAYLKYANEKYVGYYSVPDLYIHFRRDTRAAGMLAGWQFCIKRHFVIDLTAGAGIAYTTQTQIEKWYPLYQSGHRSLFDLDAKLAVNVGYRF